MRDLANSRTQVYFLVRVKVNHSHFSRKSRTASYLAMRQIWHDTGHYYFAPGTGVKYLYCDEYVCLSVCSLTQLENRTKFCMLLIYGRDSVLLGGAAMRYVLPVLQLTMLSHNGPCHVVSTFLSSDRIRQA